jgi:peroxiredoxin
MSNPLPRRIGPGAFLLIACMVLSYPTHCFGAIGVGQSAPDFELADLDGNHHNLSEVGGKVVLLYFVGYNASVCTDPARDLDRDLFQRYQSKGFQVFAIDCWDGSRDQVNRFRQNTDISYPVLMSGSSTASDYNLSYNSFVLIDTRGTVRYVSAGPSASAYNASALESAVARLLDEANESKEKTWGAIKTLYVPRLKRAR